MCLMHTGPSSNGSYFSSAGGFSQPDGPSADRGDSTADASVCSTDVQGGHRGGEQAVAVSGRCLEHPQVGQCWTYFSFTFDKTYAMSLQKSTYLLVVCSRAFSPFTCYLYPTFYSYSIHFLNDVLFLNILFNNADTGGFLYKQTIGFEMTCIHKCQSSGFYPFFNILYYKKNTYILF